MNSKTNIIAIMVLLIIAGTVFYRSYFSGPQLTFTITITDDGFSPDPVKIQKGTKIIFLNKGQNPHWPASDFHPTHGIYPEFDPLKGISPSEEWSFTLKPGKWHYHDHLYPSFTGTIEVEK